MSFKRHILSRLLEVASCLLPVRPHVVIHGFPADEGNVVEVAASLSTRYGGRIFWLVDEKNEWRLSSDLKNVVLIPKYSLNAVFRYITAETVFFTHGLFGDTRPTRGRTFVNLWHGDGFKVKKDAESAKRSIYPAQFTVGCTSLLATRRAEDFRMPKEGILHVGNPRMDQFYRPMSDESREKLGLSAGEKFVVWVPTFRSNHGAGATRGWSDVGPDAPNPNDYMGPVVTDLQKQGYSVIIKPHPQDRESRSVPNTLVIDNEHLNEAGTTFYELLGASAAIITDYSSVWTEYLALDRPIGFVIPDRDQYLETRGLYPSNLFEWLPGPQLEIGDPIGEFIQQFLFDTDGLGRKARERAASILGLAHGSGHTTDSLLDLLDSKHVFRKSGGLAKEGSTWISSQAVIQRVREQK